MVGASAGGLAQVAVYPLEVIQTRLAATHGAYAGIADAAAKIWRTEGAAAFMRCARPCSSGARGGAARLPENWAARRAQALPHTPRARRTGGSSARGLCRQRVAAVGTELCL